MENRKQGYNPMKAVSGCAPRSEKKQTVTITEDLKVIVNANNGVYDGAEHVHINGEFVMNAKSVSLLVAALEGKNIHIMSDYPFFDSFILGKESAKVIANRLAEREKKCDELESKFKRLREAINEFNNTRRPWERKLNIEMK